MRSTQHSQVSDDFPGNPRKIHQIALSYKHTIDSRLIQRMQRFVIDGLRKTSKIGLDNIVVGLSGGVDSATAATLCRNAVGADSVTAVIVDLNARGHREQTRFAKSIAKELGLKYTILRAPSLLDGYRRSIKEKGPYTEINIITRAIHNLVFQFADSKMAAVVSTVGKSETILGRHMEYFYGHFAPLIDLYKTEVIDLAGLLGVPERVREREPGCVDGWLDKKVFGVSYQVLDPLLYLMAEKGWSASKITSKYEIDSSWLRKIEYRIQNQRWRMETNPLVLD